MQFGQYRFVKLFNRIHTEKFYKSLAYAPLIFIKERNFRLNTISLLKKSFTKNSQQAGFYKHSKYAARNAEQISEFDFNDLPTLYSVAVSALDARIKKFHNKLSDFDFSYLLTLLYSPNCDNFGGNASRYCVCSTTPYIIFATPYLKLRYFGA